MRKRGVAYGNFITEGDGDMNETYSIVYSICG